MTCNAIIPLMIILLKIYLQYKQDVNLERCLFLTFFSFLNLFIEVNLYNLYLFFNDIACFRRFLCKKYFSLLFVTSLQQAFIISLKPCFHIFISTLRTSTSLCVKPLYPWRLYKHFRWLYMYL